MARMARSMSSSAVADVERESISSHARSGIELTDKPPPILPTDSVVRGDDGKGNDARRAAAPAAAWTAFGTPYAAHECPPGPEYDTRNRREPSARWMIR